MPSLHLLTSKPPTSTLYPVPDDGKIHTIPLDLNLPGEHSLRVQLGDHRPQKHAVSSSSSSSAAPAAATAGHKRSRLSGFVASRGGSYELPSALPAIQSGGNAPLSLTLRYTPPTTQQDQKAARDVQQYHTRTIRQIETALENAKLHQIRLESDQNSNNDDIAAVGLECRSLRCGLLEHRAIEELYFEQTTTHKWFVVQAGVPSRLLGVPGSPVVCLYGGDGIVDVTSWDEAVTKPQQVPVVPLRPIEGKFVKEIALDDNSPRFVACHAGKVYVTHSGMGKISVLDVERGAVVEQWTIPGARQLSGVVAHGVHVFVADDSKGCIRVLDMQGKQEGQIGSRGSGNGQFEGSCGVAIAGDLLYVRDFSNHRVQVFRLDGTWVRSWGSQGTGEGQLSYPRGFTVHEDEVYVTDFNHRVQVFGLDGTFRRMWGSQGTGKGEFYYPCDVIVHGKLVYVTDIYNHRVQVFNQNGSFVRSWGIKGSAAGQFNQPQGLCVDDKDRMWVCDHWNRRLQVFR